MSRSAEPLAESAWIPGFVLAFGLASVVLLVASDHIRQRSAIEDAYSLLDCEQIRLDLAISHLWLEEYVSGDDVDVDEILSRLDNAIAHLDHLAGATIDPVEGSGSVLTSPPLHDPALRRQAASLRPRLENFRALSNERQQGFAQDLPVGIGSPLDIEYDRAFADLLSATAALEEGLLQHHQRHRRQAHRLFLTIVVLWGLLVTLAALGLWARQKRQAKAESDLQESRAQLTHSQRMDAAGRLAGGLAHDLSNYLAAIRGHCELTRLKSPTGPQLAHRMDEVIQTVDRASDLVDRLLAFGRRQPMHPTAVDAQRLLADVAEMLGPSMGDRVHLDIDQPVADTVQGEDASRRGVWPIHVDRTGLEQALVNLLVNARDAMPQGGSVTLRARNLPASEQHDDEVEISVRDRGVGIAPQDLERIFDPFWTTKRATGGSGLGLSVVYSFVEQSGGHLFVDSTLGEGTVFRLRFPRCRDAAPPAHSAPSSSPEAVPPTGASQAPAPSHGGPEGAATDPADLTEEGFEELVDGDLEGEETLLLVDDNEALRRATQEVLEALGYRVLAAADGAQALELNRLHKVDLQVIDWSLPDMDGGQLLAELDRHGQHRDNQSETAPRAVPTIMISGHHPRDLTLPARAGLQLLPKRQLSAFRLAQQIRCKLDAPAAVD